jgi:succinate dehydrogenase/fumarate reductase flavoprotein subunit
MRRQKTGAEFYPEMADMMWAVYGVNRLVGNAIYDIAIFGRIAGEQAVMFAKDH